MRVSTGRARPLLTPPPKIPALILTTKFWKIFLFCVFWRKSWIFISLYVFTVFNVLKWLKYSGWWNSHSNPSKWPESWSGLFGTAVLYCVAPQLRELFKKMTEIFDPLKNCFSCDLIFSKLVGCIENFPRYAFWRSFRSKELAVFDLGHLHLFFFPVEFQ